MCITGNGATLTFGTTGITLRLIRVGEMTEEVTDIEDNDLGLADGDWMQFCPGKLIEHSTLPIDAVVDPDEEPALGTEELVTLRYQPPAGKTNGATVSGTGWLRKRSTGNLETNQRVEGAYEVRFKGGSAGIVRADAT